MSGEKIVLWRPMYDPAGAEKLRQRGAQVEVVDSDNPADVKKALADAKALWVRYPQTVTADILDSGRDLVCVSTSGFGYDRVDIPAATERGILVVNNQGFGRVPVSEHTLMLLLATLKQYMWSDGATRDGSAWDKRSGLPIYELEGKTVGIIGLGWVGSELARKLKLAFHCRVLGYDPYVDPRIPLLVGIERMGNLMDMLGQCDLLCMCPELTEETRMMIGKKELAALPKGAFVVNTSRGRVLDLEALADAVDSGHVAAAGIDVFEPEPLPPGHRILKHDRITVTPHIAGMTMETSMRLTENAVEQMLTVLNGDVPPFPLNPQVWDAPQSRRPRPNAPR
ncbi:MAG: NAD(P)-dependent oxidoreductase [Alphaproteobacteria bacterium]